MNWLEDFSSSGIASEANIDNRTRAIKRESDRLDLLAKQTNVKNAERQGKALDFEYEKAVNMQKMKDQFYPIPDEFAKDSPSLLKLWQGKAKEGGLGDQIKEINGQLFATGNVQEYIMGMYSGTSKNASEFKKSTYEARKYDISNALIAAKQQLATNKNAEGKALKDEEKQVLEKQITEGNSILAQILTMEGHLKEKENTGKVKPWGEGKDKVPIYINDTTGEAFKNGQPYHLKAGDVPYSEIQQPSISVHITQPGETETKKRQREWDDLSLEEKAYFHNNPLEYDMYLNPSRRPKEEGDGKGLPITFTRDESGKRVRK